MSRLSIRRQNVLLHAYISIKCIEISHKKTCCKQQTLKESKNIEKLNMTYKIRIVSGRAHIKRSEQ